LSVLASYLAMWLATIQVSPLESAVIRSKYWALHGNEDVQGNA